MAGWVGCGEVQRNTREEGMRVPVLKLVVELHKMVGLVGLGFVGAGDKKLVATGG